MHLRCLGSRARVLDERVRLHGIGADLVAHRYFAFFVVGLFDLGAALLLLDAIQLRLEQLQRHGVVLVLAALAAAFGGNARGQVRVANTAFGLVLVLPARTAAAEGIALQVFGADIDLNRALDLRQHVHGGE